MLKKILAAIGVTLTLIAGPASGGSDHEALVDHARAAPERCDVAVALDLGALFAAELARADQ